MKSEETLKFFRHWLLLLGAACVWFLWESLYVRNIWFFAVAGIGLVCAIIFLVTWKIELKFEKIIPHLKNQTVIWVVFSVLALLFTLLFFNFQFHIFNYGSGRFAFLVGLSGIFALLLAQNSQSSVYLNFAKSLLVFAVLHRVGVFVPEIQSGPFAMGWSEGSRFYNASLFVSEKLYGIKLPLPVLHPSRYLLQALPFFVGIRSILFHRIWQVVLWIGMTLWGSWLMAKRFNNTGKGSLPWLTALLFLFFFQGAVYYHLMVCVVLVLMGHKKDRPLRTLIFVLLASAWAGISRVNWMPVPGVMAVALYLLDTTFDGKKWAKYLMWPVVWVISGLVVAYLTKQGYIAISGEDPALFDSAFSSALIWRRLWPSATFFLGILPAILLVMLPGAALLWLKFRQKSLPALHWLQWLGLTGILGVFFAGGLVVSVKIGGGGDLHNLDGFLVFWALITGVILGMSSPSSNPDPKTNEIPRWRFWLAMAVIIPVFFAFMHSGSWSFSTAQSHGSELDDLKRAVAVLQENGGEVLFISERQLLTFGELDLPVVPEYEKVFLMEMLMSNNPEYMGAFRESIEADEYVAIITDWVNVRYYDSNSGFSQENNAWVEKVVLRMFHNYKVVLSWRNGEINLLVPHSMPELIQQLLESQQPGN